MRYGFTFLLLAALYVAAPVFAADFIEGRLCIEVTQETADKLMQPQSPSLASLPDDAVVRPIFNEPRRPEYREAFRQSGLGRWFLVEVNPGLMSTDKLVERIGKEQGVLQAVPDAVVTACSLPDEYSHYDHWPLEVMQCESAWDIHHDARDVTIAILDSGIEPSHEDLADNIWINPGEDVNGNGIWDEEDDNGVDDDGNGVVDDIMGYDFITITENQITQSGMMPIEGQDYGPEDNEAFPDYVGHGTYVAGIAGAVTDNGIGVASACWGATLMPLRIAFPVIYMGQVTAMTTQAEFSRAIQYAVDNGADVINMSMGSFTPLPVVQSALNYAVALGVIPVAGAGNGGNSDNFYPAAYDDVISVAATDSNDIKASFSCYGATVNVCAPGVGIWSTSPTYGVHDSLYAVHDGTSASTPFVSSAVALLLSAEPDIDPLDVPSRLEAACVNIDSLNPGFENMLGAGRLDIHRLLDPASSGVQHGPDRPVPSQYALESIYPNPFNSTTTISFQVPQASRVSISVFDVLGRKVATLMDGMISAGSHRVPFHASGYAGGTYFIRMKAPGVNVTRKVVYVN